MATINERLAVFAADFAAVQQPYQAIRKAIKDNKPTDAYKDVSQIADQAAARCGDEALEPFDSWVVRESLLVDPWDTHRYRPDIPTRRGLARDNLAAMSRVAAGLENGSSHAAILDTYDVGLFETHGAQDLVHEKHKATYYENGFGGHNESEPAKEGVFLCWSGGIGVRAHREDNSTAVNYRVDMNGSYRLPVFIEKRSSSLGIRTHTYPRAVEPRLDPADSKYDLPFIPLGSVNTPRPSRELAKAVSKDNHRFALRTAAYIGSCVSWLTIKPPSQEFCDIIVGDLANRVLTLLTSGVGFDTAQQVAARSVAIHRGSNRIAQSSKVVDYPLTQIYAFLYGACADTDNLKEKCLESVRKKPNTLRQLAGQVAIKRDVDSFFKALQNL